jgi:hypothetical protein
MMMTAYRVQLAISLLAATCAVQSHAQFSSEARLNPGEQSTPEVTVSSSDAPTGNSVNQTERSREVPALDGGGLISMSSIRNSRLLFGGTISGGFDSNPQNLGNAKLSTNYSFSPYLGFQASTYRSQLFLQYHPTISQYSNYAGQTMHLATGQVVGSFSPRLTWAAGISGSHGDDSLRLLEPTQSVSAGVLPGSGAFLQDAGTVTDLDGAFDLHYEASPRDTIGLHFVDSYNSSSAMHQSGSVAGASVNYDHTLKPNFSLLVYGQNSKYLGDLKCTAFGGGVGIRWQPQESTLLSLKGGPQIDTPGCKSQQGFSYAAFISRKLPHRSQLSATADRQPVISYLGSGLWQDDISGGYDRQIRSANIVSFDVGYIHSSTLVNVGAYHGTFYEISYARRLHTGLSLSCAYRSFMGNTNGTPFNRNVLQFSLTFSPNARTLFQ